MYISKIKMSRRVAQRKNLYDCYRYHKFVWKFFTSASQRNFLFDVERTSDAIEISVISELKPVNPFAEFVNLLIRHFPDDYFDYRKYDFQVKFCPTKKVLRDKSKVGKSEGKKRFKRFYLSNEEEIKEFVIRNFAKYNISVSSVSVQSKPHTEFYKKDNRNRYRTHVKCIGTLEAQNKEDVKKIMLAGIGRGKSDGFGMIKMCPTK